MKIKYFFVSKSSFGTISCAYNWLIFNIPHTAPVKNVILTISLAIVGSKNELFWYGSDSLFRTAILLHLRPRVMIENEWNKSFRSAAENSNIILFYVQFIMDVIFSWICATRINFINSIDEVVRHSAHANMLWI